MKMALFIETLFWLPSLTLLPHIDLIAAPGRNRQTVDSAGNVGYYTSLAP